MTEKTNQGCEEGSASDSISMEDSKHSLNPSQVNMKPQRKACLSQFFVLSISCQAFQKKKMSQDLMKDKKHSLERPHKSKNQT